MNRMSEAKTVDEIHGLTKHTRSRVEHAWKVCKEIFGDKATADAAVMLAKMMLESEGGGAKFGHTGG